MYRILITTIILLWATSAAAGLNDWTFCGGGGSTSSSVGEKVCKQRTWTDDVTEGFSIRVLADTALIAFEADKDGTSTTTTVQLWRCLSGYVPANDAGAADSCIKMTDAVWNGTGGGATNQKFAERVGPGLYWLEIVTNGGTDDTAYVQVQGD